MPKTGGQETRNRILHRVMRLFRERGYNSLGIDEIIEKCAVSKGAFYYHFPSKQALAEAVIDLHIALAPQMVHVPFEGRSWAEGTEAFVESLLGPKGKPHIIGAPMANLGLQFAHSRPRLLRKVAVALKAVEDALAVDIAKHGLAPAVASRRAGTFIALFEGHVLRMLFTRDPAVMPKLISDLTSLVPEGQRVPPPLPAWGGPSSAFSEQARKKNPEYFLDFVDKPSIMQHRDFVRSKAAGTTEKRAEIVCKAASLFWRGGYYSTSVNHLAAAACVPKGSFQLYFRTKRDVALEVLREYGRREEALFDRAFAEGGWHKAAAVLCAALDRYGFGRYVFGCPLGNMGFEFASADRVLSRRVAGLLQTTERRLAEGLARAFGAAIDASGRAATAVALCEGHLTRMAIYRDRGIVAQLREDLCTMVGENREAGG